MVKVEDINSNSEKVWELLGNFFENAQDKFKSLFTAFWEASYRAALTKELLLDAIMKSYYIADMSETLPLYSLSFLALKDNLEGVYLQPPILDEPVFSSTEVPADKHTYQYRISSVNSQGETVPSAITRIDGAVAITALNPVVLSWGEVAGADSYNVYRKINGGWRLVGATSFLTLTDTGVADISANKAPEAVNSALTGYLYPLSDTLYFLYVYGMEVNKVAAAPVIVDFNKLLLPADTAFLTEDSTDYAEIEFKASLAVNPKLYYTYYKSLFSFDFLEFLNSYTPHIAGWSSLAYEEKEESRALFLKQLLWGFHYFSKMKPTLSNLRYLFSLAYGAPFSYEGGEVTDITGDVITITGDNVYSYSIGAWAHKFIVGNTVAKFESLVDGIQVEDYYSDQALIESLATADEEPRIILKVGTTLDFPFSENIVNALKERSVPAGLIVK